MFLVLILFLLIHQTEMYVGATLDERAALLFSHFESVHTNARLELRSVLESCKIYDALKINWDVVSAGLNSCQINHSNILSRLDVAPHDSQKHWFEQFVNKLPISDLSELLFLFTGACSLPLNDQPHFKVHNVSLSYHIYSKGCLGGYQG
jgi:hypothetical protein